MTLTEARIMARIIGEANDWAPAAMRAQIRQFNRENLGYRLRGTKKPLYARGPYQPGVRFPRGLYVRVDCS